MIEINRHYRFDYPQHLTTLPDYTAHNGQMVKVLRKLGTDEVDEELSMFEVEAPDGWKGHADECELQDDDGTSGQDRDSYSDTQDRDSYSVDEDEDD